MKAITLIASLGLLCATPALAEGQDSASSESESDVETFNTRRIPRVQMDRTAGGDKGVSALSKEDMLLLQSMEYDRIVYRGAEVTKMDPGFVQGCREGLELVYLRDYSGARDHFVTLEESYPNTAISSVINTIVWQAMMLENFDFKYEDQYLVSSEQARKDLESARAEPGNEGWEAFLTAGIVGIEAIHSMRREKYVAALTLAFEALDHATQAKEHIPDFTDLLLADGMYNYWRSVITIATPMLPDFGDERITGIQQMQVVESQGIFLQAPTRLALAFTWIEERDLKRATENCVANRIKYPDNVINNMMLGTVLTYRRQYEKAIQMYDEVLRVDPRNQRVHYYRGLALMRSGRSVEAREEFTGYLDYEHIEPYQEAAVYYRLGQVEQRQKNYPLAYAHFKKAVKINGHKGAKNRIDRMKQKRKEGKIDF